MEEPHISHIVALPPAEIQVAIFEEYALAVGKVAHAWNYLQEKLGELFVVVTGMESEIAQAVWYSSDSDRTQRGMLKAAISASAHDRWKDRIPNVKADLLYLVDRANALGNNRNDAIHAPCVLAIGGSTDGSTQMAASYFSSHARAKNLIGKDLLTEFDWLERYSENLSRYSVQARRSLISDIYPWPKRPSPPDHQPKKVLRDRRHQPLPK